MLALVSVLLIPIGIVLGILLGIVFLYLGARGANIEEVTFGKAVIAYFVNCAVGLILGTFLSFIPIIGTIIALLISMVFSIFVIKGVFETTFLKALFAWLITLLLAVIAALILGGIAWIILSLSISY